MTWISALVGVPHIVGLVKLYCRRKTMDTRYINPVMVLDVLHVEVYSFHNRDIVFIFIGMELDAAMMALFKALTTMTFL